MENTILHHNVNLEQCLGRDSCGFHILYMYCTRLFCLDGHEGSHE